MTKAEYRPNPDPQWVKETMVEDYLEIARRRGVDASSADAERVALGDLESYEALQRDAKPRQAKAPVVDREHPAEKMAEELGWKMFKRPIAQRPKAPSVTAFLSKRPGSPKQAAAIARLGMILKPASWFRPSKEFDYALPRLASSFVQSMRELEAGRGEFAGKSAKDCERIMWRRVEDLCDKSTGRLGPWWVK